MSDPFRRNLVLLWIGQFVSATGDALFLASTMWLAVASTGREESAGLLVFVAAVPYLLFGPPAGAWVDRTDRRRVMVASDLARAALLLPLPWIAGGTGVGLPLLLLVAFLLGTFSSPFQPARDALLPDLVAGRSLTRWNAALQTSGQVAQVAGLVAAGAFLAQEGSGGGETDAVLRVLQYDGLTFLVSAATLACLVLPRGSRPAAARRSVGADFREGFAYAVRDPVVRPLLLLTALDNLAIMGPATVGATILVKETMGLTAGHLAWFEGAMAGGMLLGSLFLARFARRLRPGTLVLWGMVMDGLTYLPFAFLQDYGVGIAWIVLHGFFIPWIVVGRTTLLQARLPAHARGKVFALVGVTVVGMTALSGLASGWIGAEAGPNALFLLAGSFGALCGFVGLARFAAAFRSPP